MRDRLLLALHFDAEAMRHDLERLDQPGWIDHYVKANYEGSWSVLPLRAPAAARHPTQTIYADPTCDEFVDTPQLASSPYFQQVLAQFECPLRAVRLMRLTPGSTIRPHSDPDLGSESGKARLHVPITTNSEVDFRLNGERVVMLEGECWYLRLSDVHAVANRGRTDRVHLVIDTLLNPWLEARLIAAEESAAKRVEARSGSEQISTKAVPSLSDLDRFRSVVLADPILQQRLDEPLEPSAFVALALELAARRGFEITAHDLYNAMAERRPAPVIGEAGSEPPLTGWIPIRVRRDDQRHVVDWCYLGEEGFTDPFFEQTARRCRAKPFHRLFARQTAIETLTQEARAHPGITPTAFIFHGSRCGSTLFSQLAAALPGTIVISEAPPLDQILRAAAPEEQRVEWLRAIVSALGQRRRGDERHLFVKLDAWHIIDLPLIRRAFPDIPLVFLYRQPAEVIASQMRMPGIQMIPGMLDPPLAGLSLPTGNHPGREEYAARVLALLYATAATQAEAGLVTLINYRELPQAAIRQLLAWCRLTESGELAARLHEVAACDAKTPGLPFDPADVSSLPAATGPVAEAARQFVTPHYELLESIRLGLTSDMLMPSLKSEQRHQ
jgi:gluconate kinase